MWCCVLIFVPIADAKSRIRETTCDAVRGLLPAATLSNVGVYGTGQSFEALVLRMRAHPLPEARAYAELVLDELRKTCPARKNEDPVDLELALKLLQQPDLYNAAVKLADPADAQVDDAAEALLPFVP